MDDATTTKPEELAEAQQEALDLLDTLARALREKAGS